MGNKRFFGVMRGLQRRDAVKRRHLNVRIFFEERVTRTKRITWKCVTFVPSYCDVVTGKPIRCRKSVNPALHPVAE